MSDQPIHIAISTCPNDTFAFGSLLEQRIDAPAMQFTLDDIQALNERLMRGEFDVAKASFHAALHLARDYCVLPVGAALGFGVGPLLLAANEELSNRAPQAEDKVRCPGKWTTANLLYKLYCPNGPDAEHCVFSEIMPALQQHDSDYGVVIHEGRFTYQQLGLHCAIDLGDKWERDTNVPLPLGGIVARKSLGNDKLKQITQAIRDSLALAKAQPRSMLGVMSKYAQEFSEEVLMQHVKLYVNEATEDLGKQGRDALAMLAQRARSMGLIDQDITLGIAD